MVFGLIGDGYVATYHKNAIKYIDSNYRIYDPIKYPNNYHELGKEFFSGLDYVVICSPTNFHREHIKLALEYNKKIIVEKPMVLPWEPLIDNNNINIVLQLNWIDLPSEAEQIKVTMVRNLEYFKTWKGNVQHTGGVFYHLFIHYIFLAIKLQAEFEGIVITEGKQERKIDNINIEKLNMNDLYIQMYKDIVFNNKGIKPQNIFYLNWVLNRCSWNYGMGTNVINKKIRFNPKDGF